MMFVILLCKKINFTLYPFGFLKFFKIEVLLKLTNFTRTVGVYLFKYKLSKST